LGNKYGGISLGVAEFGMKYSVCSKLLLVVNIVLRMEDMYRMFIMLTISKDRLWYHDFVLINSVDGVV
jgi:hypothetical protein